MHNTERNNTSIGCKKYPLQEFRIRSEGIPECSGIYGTYPSDKNTLYIRRKKANNYFPRLRASQSCLASNLTQIPRVVSLWTKIMYSRSIQVKASWICMMFTFIYKCFSYFICNNIVAFKFDQKEKTCCFVSHVPVTFY